MPKIKFKIPGQYRGAEFRQEIERRLNYPVPQWRFKYWLKIGLLPPGDIRRRGTQGGMSCFQAWSDSLVEQSIAYLSLHIPADERG